MDETRGVMVLLSGLPGTGKTTFAAKLAVTAGATLVESDAVRRELFARPSHERGESRVVFDAVEGRAQAILAAGGVVVIDATNLNRADRERFRGLAGLTGCAVLGVRLTAGRAVVEGRLARPRRGWSDADFEVYERMVEREELLGIPHVVVDSGHDVEASVALVARLVESAQW